MDTAQLNDNFGIAGALQFTEDRGLIRAEITTPAASATVYLHGGHLTQWEQTGEKGLIFLSKRSPFAADEPIRGGIPVIFPWFGPDTAGRNAGKAGPAHGFARIQPWDVAFAALAGDDLHLTLTLGPTDLSRSFGYDGFRLALEFSIGHTLKVNLIVANQSGEPLRFEEALHTYFQVGDVRRATVTGLEGVHYLDKVDGMRQKSDPKTLQLTGRTDRVYLDTESTCVIDDPAGGRRITVEKAGSRNTVVWNPWAELTATLADMEPEAWPEMLCVETANIGTNAIEIAPGARHTMRAVLSTSKP